jgi:hypothetical protein
MMILFHFHVHHLDIIFGVWDQGTWWNEPLSIQTMQQRLSNFPV